jgi:hypothetical protein
MAMALAPLLPHLKQTGFRVGDLVQIVALPWYTDAWGGSKNRDCRKHARVLRQCLGGRYPVVYVGDDSYDSNRLYRKCSIDNFSEVIVGLEPLDRLDMRGLNIPRHPSRL